MIFEKHKTLRLKCWPEILWFITIYSYTSSQSLPP